MTFFDDSFLEQLRKTFNIEAQEHLQEMGNLLIQLEKKTEDQQKAQIIEKIFRAAHSLKGAARSLDLTEVESICQALEDVFALMKEGYHFDNQKYFDVLHQAFEVTHNAIFEPQKNNSMRVVNIIDKLSKIVNSVKETSQKDIEIPKEKNTSRNSQDNGESSVQTTDDDGSNYDIFEDEEFLKELKETFK